MFTKKFAALILVPAFAISMASAAADKACLKTAKADNKTAMAACKEKKGDEKKSCLKDAKEAYKTAKAACSAPAAPATDSSSAAPAAAPQ